MIKLVLVLLSINFFISIIYTRMKQKSKQLGFLFIIFIIIGNTIMFLILAFRYINLELIESIAALGLYNLISLTFISFHSGVETMSPSMLIMSKVLSEPKLKDSDLYELRLEQLALNDRVTRLRSSNIFYSNKSTSKINFFARFLLVLIFTLFPIKTDV
jgi:hypothetical protein